MKISPFAVTKVLILVESIDAQLAPIPRRLRSLSTTVANSPQDDLALVRLQRDPLASLSMGRYAFAQDISGSDAVVIAGKAGKSSKSTEDESLTGFYFAFDTEDASRQSLTLLCDVSHCNITLIDVRFSTCEKITGIDSYNVGIGIAKQVPRGSLSDFPIELFCMEEGDTKIDYSRGPTTSLLGDMEFFPNNGGIIRKGPGFKYFKTSLDQIIDLNGKSPDINNKSINLNGKYIGADLIDGSRQIWDIVCTQKECDFFIEELGFQICEEKSGLEFWNGAALARNVSRNSLGAFDLEIYCLPPGEIEIDYSKEPEEKRRISLVLLGEGILTDGLGNTLIKVGPGEDDGPFSVYDNIYMKLFGQDRDDGTAQVLTLDCKEGLCDVFLQDSLFGICTKNTPANIFLGGVAYAKGVPQDSLYKFTLELFCAFDSISGINYTAPAATLRGDLTFLQNGIATRTANDFIYIDWYRTGNEINGIYLGGLISDDGGFYLLEILCMSSVCEVILQPSIDVRCIGPSRRSIISSLAVKRDHPEESLDKPFQIGTWCAQPEIGSNIDYRKDPDYTSTVQIIQDSSLGGIVHLTVDGQEQKMSKISVD